MGTAGLTASSTGVPGSARHISSRFDLPQDTLLNCNSEGRPGTSA
jgi:hypothetical protein